MIRQHIIPVVSSALLAFIIPARGTQFTDEQLAQIQFDQKLGAQVSPSSKFQDETGRPVSLANYFGERPTVLILGYYGCPMLCTLVLNGAAECFRNMKWKAGEQFNVVFVSVDPRETSSLAAEKKLSYVQSYGKAGAGSWHFLTGSQNAITNLAGEVGFQYVYDDETKQFAHPSGLVILAADGKLARYFFGVNFAAKDLDAALRDAAVNQVGAPEAPFTLLCFHYAPIHGKYGKLIMDVVRGGGCLVLLLLTGLILMPPGRRKKGEAK